MRRIRVGLPSVVPELSTALYDLRRADGSHIPEFLGEGEVHVGLLGRRIQVQEHDVFRRQTGQDRVAHRAAVALRVEAGEKKVETRGLGTDVPQGDRLKKLEGVEGRERLKFDQFRTQAPAGRAHDGEVRDSEEGMGVAAGNIEPGRHCRL
jgi:hypothetical protein